MRIDRIKLKTELWKRDMKQKELAEAAGVSKETVTNICSGRSCSNLTGKALAAALGMDITELLEESID